MDGKFVEVARAATTGSSHVLPVIDRPDRSRIRTASAPGNPLLTPFVRLQLVEQDGILEWEDITAAPPDLGRFRGTTATKPTQSCDALELEFERLPPSMITQFLCGRDDKLTPHRGLRRLDAETRQLVPAPFPQAGEALILLHGTFSNSENMIAGLLDDANSVGRQFLDQALRRYRGNVFLFDHPTLAVGPIFNAWDLQRAIGFSDAKIHLVGHSRGGLVARWWCETFDPLARRCEKVVFVGSPLSGTGLAAPPNIRKTIHLLTQFSQALQSVAGLTALAVPVFSVVEALLRVMTSITSLAARTPVADAAMAMVPGLFGMSRVGNNPELLRLLDTSAPLWERYHAVQSDFQPLDPGWKFWQLFRKSQLADNAAEVLFDGANDLVVDTLSMTRLSGDNGVIHAKIPATRLLDFGASPLVHHLNYFYQGETAKFLGDRLL